MELILTNQQREIIVNEHMLKRYTKFISIVRLKKPSEGENHHIIPICIGGSDDITNMGFIGYREHYIAHYMLAKIFKHDKLWFAFNCMKRVCNKKSVLYEAARKYISECIRRCNTGRIHTQEFKDAISKRTKGTIIVKNKNGICSRVSVLDERYLSGELVYYRTGTTLKDSTKYKIGCGLRNKTGCYYVDSRRMIYLDDNQLHLIDNINLIKGMPPERSIIHVENLRKPRNLKLVICPYCECQGKGGNMTRYHFEHCKENK